MVDDRADKYISDAFSLRKKGYNCSQCIMMAYSNDLKMPEQMLASMSCSCGGGYGGSGELCGVLASIGMIYSTLRCESPGDKAKIYKVVRQMKDEFEKKYGYCRCRDLKGGRIPCENLIEGGIRILNRHLTEKI